MLRDIYKLEKAKRVSVKATSVSKISTYEYDKNREYICFKTGGDIRKNPVGRTRSNIPPPKEPQHAVVSKSRSVDNVGVLTQSGQYQSLADPFTFQTAQDKNAAANFAYQAPSTENLHRKLARQLTLNPVGDPRLANRRFPPLSPSPVGPTGGFLGASGWDVHQGVTRIASAPDSYRSAQSQAGGWNGMQTLQPGVSAIMIVL